MLNVKNIKIIEELGKSQNVISTGKDIIFQSYNSTIAIIRCGEVIYIGFDYNYSKTTGKFRNRFFKKYLNKLTNIKDLRKFIDEKMKYSRENGGYISKEYEYIFN